LYCAPLKVPEARFSLTLIIVVIADLTLVQLLESVQPGMAVANDTQCETCYLDFVKIIFKNVLNDSK